MTKARILNCSSVESTTESLAAVLGMSVSELVLRLEGFDDEAQQRKHAHGVYDYEKVLAAHTLGSAPDGTSPPDEVVWFHATRVARSVQFQRDGLLPLRTCIDALRETVTSIARDLGIMADAGAISGSFGAKLCSLDAQGPCASLLRDAAVNPGTSHRNFLESPEVVEDIAVEIGGSRFDEILSRYKANTRPCVVSFRSAEIRPDVISLALAYLHSSLRGGSDPVHWNTCFDGEGRPIPAADIVGVDWIDV